MRSRDIKTRRTTARRVASFTLVAFALAALSGCSRGDADLRAYIQQINARPAAPLEPLPVIQQFETFEYSAQNLRDPFSTPLQEQETTASAGLRPDPDRRKELLEAFPLDSLDMVGTLGTGASMLGLIVDPEGVVYRVRPGNYMGQSDGKIKAVHEDRIDLVELVPDGAGGWIERDATVALDDQ
ncbi:MAG: pilus assembly protein PilP [Xanthomonadales bacterium]|nr:pilus assembly protein PilP [Xanthomonadales bacterium]